MKIAIIGSGNVGSAIGSNAVRAGHQVTLSATDPEHAREAADRIRASAARSNEEAVADADLVILAVPQDALSSIAADLAERLNEQIVVDVANRPTPDPSGSAGTSIAEELQAALPRAHVVKAFNTLFASRQADPAIAGRSADGYVTGDNEEAKQQVLALLESMGFRPIDAGPLAAARTLEGMAWLNISRNMQGGSWQDTWVLVGPSAPDS